MKRAALSCRCRTPERLVAVIYIERGVSFELTAYSGLAVVAVVTRCAHKKRPAPGKRKRGKDRVASPNDPARRLRNSLCAEISINNKKNHCSRTVFGASITGGAAPTEAEPGNCSRRFLLAAVRRF